MDQSPEQVRRALLSVAAFVVSVAVHEFGHAFMADRLGDGLPRRDGRVTLDPRRHIDLLGTIVLPLIAAFSPGAPLIAWGKPVQTNPASYTTRFSRGFGHMLVAVMGPAMNLALALLVSIVVVALGEAHLLPLSIAVQVCEYLLVANVMLMFFNLLPLPPLDGGAVLTWLLPARLQIVPRTLQRYGMLLLFVLVISGALSFVMQPARALAEAWALAVLQHVPA